MEEKFYSDLYDIIYDRSFKGKTLSISDFKSIISIYNKRFKTNKYIGGVKETNFDNEKQFGAYVFNSGFIKVDSNKIKDNSSFEGIFGYNIEALHTVLHELHHANQMKKLQETKICGDISDIELYLLANAYFYTKYMDDKKKVILNDWDIKTITSFGINPRSSTLAEDIKNYMMNYYYINPAERMAEIKSLSQINAMLLKYRANWNQMEILNNKLYKELVRGYNKGPKDLCYNSPSIQFFRKLFFKKEMDVLQNLVYSHRDELNNSKRLYLGIHADDEIVKKLMKSRNN